ncbi:MAG: 2-phosphosulfolactate phosphatase [Methanobrevibacter sp.]|nr:2-phosphosulfolactate phosphatase [Methanobrevibacter sp.]
MNITLSLEKTISSDVSIMVDAFRASTSIIIAMNEFNEVIPAFSPEEAIEIAKKENGVLAGERMGATLEGFDIGNSPVAIKNYTSEKKKLVLTTSNGTRILKNMNSTVLIGAFINAKSVAKLAIEIAKKHDYNHIDVVMAGWKGSFAIEDFLASGEILYWIQNELSQSAKFDNRDNNTNKDYNSENKISEYAQSAILANNDYEAVKKVIYKSRAGKGLKKLGFEKDIDFSIQKNISSNVAIYENGVLKLFNK